MRNSPIENRSSIDQSCGDNTCNVFTISKTELAPMIVSDEIFEIFLPLLLKTVVINFIDFCSWSAFLICVFMLTIAASLLTIGVVINVPQ
jgi:hypothetical protein